MAIGFPYELETFTLCDFMKLSCLSAALTVYVDW